MKYGYIYQSSQTASLEEQEQALLDVPVPKDNISQDLDSVVALLKAGDIFVVWRFDVLQMSIRRLRDFCENMKNKRIFIQSIADQVNTLTNSHEFMFSFFLNVFADCENRYRISSIKQGMDKAIAEGKKTGPRLKIDDKVEKKINDLLAKGFNLQAACTKVGISLTTYYLWKRKNVKH